MPPPRTPKHPKAEEILKSELVKADKHVQNLQDSINAAQVKLDAAKQIADEIRVDLTAIEAL